ncbi:hypothetical protein CFR75_06210 [Komagataeibacter xylinus]|uniref:Uncharacterized protein n=2 Tax=Komagataeibacter xylinus TaxID=28448 RepID=A0A318PJ38_KOMXY|nr:hypothetical protein CFR75_06210 [Komagataeibacter xylinus]
MDMQERYGNLLGAGIFVNTSGGIWTVTFKSPSFFLCILLMEQLRAFFIVSVSLLWGMFFPFNCNKTTYTRGAA